MKAWICRSPTPASARPMREPARRGAAILPQVDFGGSSTQYQGHSSQGSARETDSGALLSASYEIDFWGKNRAARDSARALERSSEADRAVVALSAVTSVANTYFEVVALREDSKYSRLLLGDARKLLEVVDARRTAGIATPTEIALQRAAVAAAEIRMREIEGQEVEAEAALAILVGKEKPGALQITQRKLTDFREPRVGCGASGATSDSSTGRVFCRTNPTIGARGPAAGTGSILSLDHVDGKRWAAKPRSAGGAHHSSRGRTIADVRGRLGADHIRRRATTRRARRGQCEGVGDDRPLQGSRSRGTVGR